MKVKESLGKPCRYMHAWIKNPGFFWYKFHENSYHVLQVTWSISGTTCTIKSHVQSQLGTVSHMSYNLLLQLRSHVVMLIHEQYIFLKKNSLIPRLFLVEELTIPPLYSSHMHNTTLTLAGGVWEWNNCKGYEPWGEGWASVGNPDFHQTWRWVRQLIICSLDFGSGWQTN